MTAVLDSKIKYYSVPEVAEMVGVTRIAILYAIKEGRIKATRVSRIWLISEEDIKAYTPRAYVRKAPRPGPRKKKLKKREAKVKTIG